MTLPVSNLGMDPSGAARRELTLKLTAAAVFLSAAVAALTSPLVSRCACILIFFRPRLGYGLGLVAGLIAVPWLVQIETAAATWNSWIFFNSEEGVLLFAKLKILSVALIVIFHCLLGTSLASARMVVGRVSLAWAHVAFFRSWLSGPGSVVRPLCKALQRPRL